MQRIRVSVWYSAKATWRVGVEGPVLNGHEWRTVIVATFTTRDAANGYAKGLRRALTGAGRG